MMVDLQVVKEAPALPGSCHNMHVLKKVMLNQAACVDFLTFHL